jgi:hypothetical protein
VEDATKGNALKEKAHGTCIESRSSNANAQKQQEF